MKITAAVLHEPRGAFKVEDVELDAPRPHEVLVKIVATGICHTDLAVRDQHLPLGLPAVLGHEGSGIVEAVGSSVTRVKPGDHVVLTPASCGECDFCVSGHPSYCEKFSVLNMQGHREDGSCAHHQHGQDLQGLFLYQSSFGSYAIATERNTIKVPTDIPLEILGPLGCGLQTGAGSVLNVLRPQAGESIAVYGTGPVGLAGIMAAKVAGCSVIVAVDINDQRLELARELGATHTVNSRNQSSADYIREHIMPAGLHYTFSTVGRNEVVAEAFKAMRYMGRCVEVGVGTSANLEIPHSLFRMGKSITYAIEGDSVPEVFIPRLIQLYRKGRFPFDKLIKFYDLDQINQAVEDSEKGVTLKAILRMPH
ncbi:aryl-alcohol dehydrogenase [Faunimonas pinastri]|uniref:Aryl-alcohol dehydrogenase n=1 Tax=Faunimonas pinastri TaxID=1855383 RepID=A0A1H9K8W4_9HYPH|nr:NAD(P)-dependent alcohol dehydrogenase [Faunimonas pinastri]SEQ95574.1 aryl-alcohol dehydrogenase [Faunimonas pinastri]